jgi:PAS domain S-box-containing protein
MFKFLAGLFNGSGSRLRQEILQRTQELRDSEARLRALFDTAGDCIITLDDEMKILTINPASETLFGLPPEQMVGRFFAEFMAGSAGSAGTWDSQLGTGEGKIFGMGGDVIGLRADGTKFPASLSMSKLNLGQGRIYTVIVHDLTRFKKTEEALRQSETRLRMVLGQVPAILCTTDRKLRVTLFTSSAATGLTGMGGPSRRFLGDSLADPEDDALRFLPAAEFQRALQGEAVSTEVDWQDRVFQFHIQPLRDARNQIQGSIGIGLDVTQRKRTEAALHFYARELQQRNAELVRSNQELDEFAYVASHDLKEPLRGINNYSSFLLEDYGDKLDQGGQGKAPALAVPDQPHGPAD